MLSSAKLMEDTSSVLKFESSSQLERIKQTVQRMAGGGEAKEGRET